jgi:hypothetical protein
MTAEHRRWFGCAAVLAAVTLGGCAGYRLGSSLPADIRAIHVPTFVNKTGEPLLEVETTAAVIREFQTDGTLKVVGDVSRADLELRAELLTYKLEALRFDPNERRTADEYRLRIEARLVCRRIGGGAVLVSRKVDGESTFTLSGSLNAAKQSALPKAARDLAHNVVEAVVEAW